LAASNNPVVQYIELCRCVEGYPLIAICFLCGCQPWTKEGMAYLEKSAGQGHAYAMGMLSEMLFKMNDDVRAMEWLTKGAEAGLPIAMFNLGCSLDKGQGVTAPDYPAAAGWYRLAADAGNASAAVNLSSMYLVGRGRAPGS